MGANAQTSVPTFTASQVLTAAQMNESARTGVPVFATTVTRDAAFGGTGEKTLAEGQMCYIEGAGNGIQIYNGSAWITVGDGGWIDYTPTWTNLTIGNATQDFRYWRSGKFVAVVGQLIWGTTTSASGAVGFSPPITAASYNSSHYIGSSSFNNASSEFFGVIRFVGTTLCQLVVSEVAATYARPAIMTNTVPFTWTSTNGAFVSFFYEAA